MARENPGWGYTRLRDALNNLGYKIGRTTIERILREHGIEPAPERKRQYSWATFIKAHLGVIAGMDFFTVEFVTALGLVRYHERLPLAARLALVLVVADSSIRRNRWQLPPVPKNHRRTDVVKLSHKLPVPCATSSQLNHRLGEGGAS